MLDLESLFAASTTPLLCPSLCPKTTPETLQKIAGMGAACPLLCRPLPELQKPPKALRRGALSLIHGSRTGVKLGTVGTMEIPRLWG